MEENIWHTGGKWPEKVRKEIDYIEEPLIAVLDNTAAQYGDKTYTISSALGTRTFSEVKDAADRIANFLVSRGIQKGE